MSSRYAEKLERELSIANQQAHDSIVECSRLLAENQRLRDELVEIEAAPSTGRLLRLHIREALAGDAE